MSRPNILWVVTTQWRGQAGGFAGDPNARTPVLDQLARDGINFAQAVTPHPFGPFARAALLTGVASPENGVRDYFDPLPTTARTVAHDLNERGYATAFFGKWHLSPRDAGAKLVGDTHAKMIVPEERRGGFHHWEGFEGGFLLNDPWLHGTEMPQPRVFTGYQSDVVTERAADWTLRQRVTPTGSVQPWFCVVSLEAPHPPYNAALPEGITARDPKDIILPPNVPCGGEAETKARTELAGYYAHIEATDRALGRLLARIDAQTVVAVTSVHGDMHGAHGLFRKGWPYEESVRVPLIVRHPKYRGGATAAATLSTGENQSLVSLLNVRAMTVGWADSVETKLENQLQKISMPSVVALPHQCDRIWKGVRSASRKLVLNEDGSPWLYFDLANDPWENRNLVGDSQWSGVITQLAALARQKENV